MSNDDDDVQRYKEYVHNVMTLAASYELCRSFVTLSDYHCLVCCMLVLSEKWLDKGIISSRSSYTCTEIQGQMSLDSSN